MREQRWFQNAEKELILVRPGNYLAQATGFWDLT